MQPRVQEPLQRPPFHPATSPCVTRLTPNRATRIHEQSVVQVLSQPTWHAPNGSSPGSLCFVRRTQPFMRSC